jgi:hypothetical protein
MTTIKKNVLKKGTLSSIYEIKNNFRFVKPYDYEHCLNPKGIFILYIILGRWIGKTIEQVYKSDYSISLNILVNITLIIRIKL